MFVFFVVKAVFASGVTVTDVKDVKVSPGFRLMSMRIISVSFGNGIHREGVLPRKIASTGDRKSVV